MIRALREHGVGFEFDGDVIVRVDSQVIHASAVKPALLLLRVTITRRQKRNFCELMNTIGMDGSRKLLRSH